jgi:hypothetical protein
MGTLNERSNVATRRCSGDLRPVEASREARPSPFAGILEACLGLVALAFGLGVPVTGGLADLLFRLPRLRRASIAQLAKAEAPWAAATEAAQSERIQLKRRIPRSDAETSAMAALLAADQLPAPPPLRKALHTIDIHLTETIDQARLLPKTA